MTVLQSSSKMWSPFLGIRLIAHSLIAQALATVMAIVPSCLELQPGLCSLPAGIKMGKPLNHRWACKHRPSLKYDTKVHLECLQAASRQRYSLVFCHTCNTPMHIDSSSLFPNDDDDDNTGNENGKERGSMAEASNLK